MNIFKILINYVYRYHNCDGVFRVYYLCIANSVIVRLLLPGDLWILSYYHRLTESIDHLYK